MSSVMRFDEWQDSNGVPVASGAGGKFVAPGGILQVVSTTKTDTFSTTSATYTAITGLSATITPSSSNSKILIVAFLNMGNENNGAHFRLSGGNTGSFVGNVASNRTTSAASLFPSQTNYDTSLTMRPATITFLDSPATTSPVTYGVEARRGTGGTAWLNRSNLDTDNAVFARGVSSITVMEVAG